MRGDIMSISISGSSLISLSFSCNAVRSKMRVNETSSKVAFIFAGSSSLTRDAKTRDRERTGKVDAVVVRMTIFVPLAAGDDKR